MRRYRIVKIENGFRNKYVVERRYKILWIYPIWLEMITCDRMEWVEDYVKTLKRPVVRTVVNID